MPLILIAQDSGVLDELESTFLDREGMELVSVTRGEDALLLAQDRNPDLAVLDASMSFPDGLETCRRFKSDVDLHTIPIILVGSFRDREQAKLAGADAFVSRPVTRASLLSQLRRFLTATERATSRLPIGLKVTCRSGEESFVAFTRNISPTGLFLKSARPPVLGSHLTVVFVLPGERQVPIESEAEVVRHVPPGEGNHVSGGVGLQFSSLSAKTKIEIGRFLRDSEAD